MLRKVWGAGVHGTEGFPVCCEADVENGFPQFTFIGSLTGAVFSFTNTDNMRKLKVKPHLNFHRKRKKNS